VHSGRTGGEGQLRFSAFVPAQSVTQYLADTAGRDEALALFRANRITKVYLDCLRGGHFPGEETLAAARDFFRDRGLAVSAGLTPTRGTGKPSSHGRHWLCYTNRSTQEELAQVVRRTARLFDEIIVDDFLCTQCQCAECREGRGGRTWGQYYGHLMPEVAQKCILEPARQENTSAHLIIKYPQWYDRFHVFGYDVRRHPLLFDEVWVGTETRDPDIEYVHQYQAFVNYRWLASLAGDKIGGAWFDFIHCYPEVYVEQAVLSVLAGARELVRFHYGPALYSPGNPNTRALLESIPALERLAAVLDGKSPRGLAFYKPPDSEGDDEAYLPDYLGMIGLPVVPSHVFPADARAVCLAAHAAQDPDIVERALALLERGGVLLLTPGFLAAVAHDARVPALAGFGTPPVIPADLWTFRFGVQRETAAAPAHVRFGARLNPATAEVLIVGVHPDGAFPVLTRHRHANGTVLVLNAKTFRYPEGSGRVTVGEPVSLPHLPQQVVDALRGEVMREMPLAVEAQARVGVFWFGGVLVLCNWNDREVGVVVRTQEAPDGPAVGVAGQTPAGEWRNGALACRVPARGFTAVEIPT
jgi:hypothetical protein